MAGTAAAAAKEVIVRNVWSIHNTGKPLTDYRDMFIDTDLSDNQEVLWWKEYNASAGIGHNVTYYACGGGQIGVSASLVNKYLTREGKPFTGTAKEEAKRIGTELTPELRDPRLSQTVFMPGQQIRSDGTLYAWPPLDATNYHQNTTGYSVLKYEEFNTSNTAAYTTANRQSGSGYSSPLCGYSVELCRGTGRT